MQFPLFNPVFVDITTTSLLHISDSVLRSYDASSLVGLDFSKAFNDTVNRELLLAKLQYYGLSSSAIKFFRSFLIDHLQKVFIRNHLPNFSSLRPIPSGVSQDSIFGPILFNIFVADLPKLRLVSNLHMYVDNVRLFLSFKGSEAVGAVKNLNNDLSLVAQWANSNGLHLNPSKSSFLTVDKSRLLSRLSSFDVSINNIHIIAIIVFKNP